MYSSKKLFLVLIFSLIAMTAACSDDEPGEWEPVPDDDDDAGNDDDDDDDDDDNDDATDDDEECACEVTEEQWQDLLDRCDGAAQVVNEKYQNPTAGELCEMCPPCMVECFQEQDYCTTPFVDCFWDCYWA